MDSGDYPEYNGKTIRYIKDNEDRHGYGDDAGIVIHFTDGTVLEISAGMGQGCGYLLGI